MRVQGFIQSRGRSWLSDTQGQVGEGKARLHSGLAPSQTPLLPPRPHARTPCTLALQAFALALSPPGHLNLNRFAPVHQLQCRLPWPRPHPSTLVTLMSFTFRPRLSVSVVSLTEPSTRQGHINVCLVSCSHLYMPAQACPRPQPREATWRPIPTGRCGSHLCWVPKASAGKGKDGPELQDWPSLQCQGGRGRRGIRRAP